MARRRSRNRVQVRVQENVTAALTELQISLRGPGVARALQTGADMIAKAARPEAPEDTGQLRAGVFTASIVRNEYRPLVRPGRGQRLDSPLKFPPRPKQALVWSSVFYTRFIEGGRKSRSQDNRRGKRSTRRGMGAIRKRPFFQRAKRRMRQPALAEIQRQLVKLVEDAWQR